LVKQSKNSRAHYVFVLTAHRSDLKIAVLSVENTAVLVINPTQLTETHLQCADFGAELRYAREGAGVTLRAIADTTKLPLTALKALEDNRIDQLPGGIYRRAIVRAYAEEIGLDAHETVRAFLDRYPDEVASNGAVEATESHPVSGWLRAGVSLVGALIPVFAGVFYFASGTEGSDSSRQVVDVIASRVDGHAADPLSAIAAANAVPMMISVSSATRLAVIADGREVVARQLEAGEIIRLTVSDDVVLMGDNAGAVHFSINGRPGRTLGDDGVPLSARIPRDDYLSWLIQQ
jgi:hypothetical protein